MSDKSRISIPIDSDLFCDGAGYLLTSQSFGGSGLTPERVSEILFEEKQDEAMALLRSGVFMPIAFEGDCALDENTTFVVGELSDIEKKDWIAKLTWKLNIPCGKLILCCGWCEEDLESAVRHDENAETNELFQVVDVPPDEYLVEVYAFAESLTVECSLYEYDEELERETENEELGEWYLKKFPGPPNTHYVIRLKPLTEEPEMPPVESCWFEKFQFRKFEIPEN